MRYWLLLVHWRDVDANSWRTDMYRGLRWCLTEVDITWSNSVPALHEYLAVTIVLAREYIWRWLCEIFRRISQHTLLCVCYVSVAAGFVLRLSLCCKWHENYGWPTKGKYLPRNSAFVTPTQDTEDEGKGRRVDTKQKRALSRHKNNAKMKR